MYDHILVPTDGSEHAERAAGHAALLAGAFDATVHLLAVLDIDAAAGPFSAGGVDEAYVQQRVTDQQSRLAELADSLAYSGDIETGVVTGAPADGILDYVADSDVDLVVMGTHGRSGLRRYLTGSVAERVLRLSPVPVVTMRATDDSAVGTGYDDLLVPTDGSERASAAVAHALAVADAFGSTVHAVSVVNVGDIDGGDLPGALRDELEATATAATETVASEAEAAGVDAVTEVLTGRPRAELLDYVADHGIDLVCMGTHGRTGLDRVLLGSTAEGLVRCADVPVLTVSEATP